MVANFTKVENTQTFDGKRYTLKDSFVSKDTGQRLKARYKRQGYLVRIIQHGGALHFLKRYHVYTRRR